MEINLQLFAVDYTKYADKGLRSSIRRNLQQVETHRDKIANPASYIADFHMRSEQYKARIIRHWEMEIVNFNKQIEMAKEELQRRGLT